MTAYTSALVKRAPQKRNLLRQKNKTEQSPTETTAELLQEHHRVHPDTKVEGGLELCKNGQHIGQWSGKRSKQDV